MIQSMVHKRPFQKRGCWQKKPRYLWHAGRLARMAKGQKPHPMRNRAGTGRKIVSGSPVRRLVMSHMAAEAWLSWSIKGRCGFSGYWHSPSEAVGCRKGRRKFCGVKPVAELCHIFGYKREYSFSEKGGLWTQTGSNPCSAAFCLHGL